MTVEPHPQFKTESTEEAVVKKVSPNRLALRFNQDCQASEDELADVYSFGDTSVFVHHEHSGR